ncbi:uncharacterized protein LOC120294272 [Eucalyptus grandis]|uniref:uncharacterized protein LOC120294272 n=1 Tax=Eucalyptus grandis TaxID=71139 RepID=UPI00192E7CAC|nr:uncharacterized protein LOC120294272 [Eucalyptus grandis]
MAPLGRLQRRPPLPSSFTKGNAVEILHPSLHGALYSTTVLQSPARAKKLIFIEYLTLTGYGGGSLEKQLREYMDLAQVRPAPPREMHKRFRVEEEADAYLEDWWHFGEIREIHKDSKYLVRGHFPWLVAGDFNAIKDPSDHIGGATNWIPCFDEFSQCLSQAELSDLRYVGCRYTLSTSSGEAKKLRKIDRVLVNGEWNTRFSYSEANFQNPGILDHCPMIVRVLQPSNRSKPFKFFNYWTHHPNFTAIIQRAWNSPVVGFPMFQLVSKLKRVKSLLKSLNRDAFSDISAKVVNARNSLAVAQNQLQANPGMSLLPKKKGNVIVFVDYFSDLMSPKEGLIKPSIEEVRRYIRNPLSLDQVLTCPSQTLRSRTHYSHWQKDIIGSIVLQSVHDFFRNAKLLKEVNATIIALVPKVPNATAVMDFRPIACCNTIYKVITKILANRIAGVLGDVISQSQNAFVKGRRMRDNILLAQELFAGFHLTSYLPKCAIKLVMACVRSPTFSISINGDLHGFFPGGRGVRQGDPMSPYLFTLVMEVFSGILRSCAFKPDFKYYWRCRLQLIRSVLHSIQASWTSVFTLPASVLADVERIMRQFLWKGTSLGRGGAKVAWEDICCPKAEGGLGVRNIKQCNRASTVKYLWILFSDKESLWCRWIHSVFLKKKNFWIANTPRTCSWMWKKILQLRPYFHSSFRWIVGNGYSISLWHDYWLSCGPLDSCVPSTFRESIGLPNRAVVADMYTPVGAALKTLLERWSIALPPLSSMHDKFIWCHESKFSVASAWDFIKVKRNHVQWASFVWDNALAPRYQFILWLITKNRLPTRDVAIILWEN